MPAPEPASVTPPGATERVTPSPTASLWRTAALRRLVVLTLCGFSSFCLTLASLPSYAVRNGVAESLAGLVTTVMLVCTVSVQFLVPGLVRRWGAAPVLAAGLVALAGPAPFYLLSDRLGWLMAVSAVRGAGFAVLTVLGSTLSAGVAPPARRGEAIGIYGLAIAVPNLLGVPAGVALVAADRFAVVAVLAAAPLLALTVVRGLGAAAVPGPAPGAGTGGRASATVRAVAGPSLALLVVTLAGGGVVTFVPIARPDGPVATLTLLVFGLTGALTRWRAGLLADRVGTRLLLPASLLAGAAGLGLLAVGLAGGGGRLTTGADGRPLATVVLIGGAALFGAGFGAVQNLTLLLAFARAGPGHTTTASAVWNAAFDAGTGLGAVLVGAVAGAGLGLPGAYAVCAAVIALAVVPARRGRLTASRPA